MGPLTWSFLSWDWVVSTIIVELGVVIVGVLIANYVIRYLKERKWGKWNLMIQNGDETLFNRSLSAATTEEIFSDETELDKFLKGRVSVFGDVRCDLVSEIKDKNSKVVTRDNKERTMTIYMNTPCARGSIGIKPRRSADDQPSVL